MRRPFWTPLRITLVTILLSLGIVATLLSLTAHGSAFLVRWSVRTVLQPEAFSVGSVKGSVWRGLTLNDIHLQNWIGAPRGSLVRISHLRLDPAGTFDIRQWRWLAAEVKCSLPGHVRDFSIGQASGSWLTGLRLHGVRAVGLPGLPDEGAFSARAADIWLHGSFLPYAWSLAVEDAQAHLPQWVRDVRCAHIEGRLDSGLVLSELEAEGFDPLPQGSTLQVQRLQFDAVRRRLEPASVLNARLHLPASDPVLASGMIRPEALDLDLYSKHVDVTTLADIFPRWALVQYAKGTLTDVSIQVSGPWRQPTATGHFLIEEFVRRGVLIRDAEGSFALTLGYTEDGLQVEGVVRPYRGIVHAKNTDIRLEPSQIRFDKNSKNPEFDLYGNATIDDVRIHVSLKGTRQSPDLRLTSEPSMPQEWLLVMLATGRRWRGAETSLTQGQISPDLAKDFLDFFVLGGLGSRIAQRFGVTDISLIFDPMERRVGAAATIADKLEVSYETDQPKPSTTLDPASMKDAQPTTYRVGAGLKLTPDSQVKIEGERQLESGTGTAEVGPNPTTTGPEPKTRDSIFLKFQKKF